MPDLDDLPPELISEIGSKLEMVDLRNLQQVSTYFRDIGRDVEQIHERKYAKQKKLLDELTSNMTKATVIAKKVKGKTKVSPLLMLNEYNPVYAKSLLMHLKAGSDDLRHINQFQKQVRNNKDKFPREIIRSAMAFKDAKDKLKQALA
ncbi:F-box protein [Phaeobacter sp. B1627]|uniref:F-box protein n=1 Tax=Phaeobacter sp. B1627 TaxID=2583809 RepID=UPI00159ED8F8|nr:F-box protein [Phaeobacter sp. B1627]